MKRLALVLTALAGFFVWSCANTGGKLTEQERKLYLEKGKEIAQASFDALGGELQQALKRGGIPDALKYCQTAALPITDSLSRVHKATIKRTSLRLRNPKNAPTRGETAVLRDFGKMAESGGAAKPAVERIDAHTVAFYAPITIKPMCLNCHGVSDESLGVDNLQLIKSLYPNDAATGYKMGDLRGMWSIVFKEDSKP